MIVYYITISYKSYHYKYVHIYQDMCISCMSKHSNSLINQSINNFCPVSRTSYSVTQPNNIARPTYQQ